MKIGEIEVEIENLKKSHIFDHEKVNFPASQFISECSGTPQKLFKNVKRRLEILSDTHKILL